MRSFTVERQPAHRSGRAVSLMGAPAQPTNVTSALATVDTDTDLNSCSSANEVSKLEDVISGLPKLNHDSPFGPSDRMTPSDDEMDIFNMAMRTQQRPQNAGKVDVTFLLSDEIFTASSDPRSVSRGTTREIKRVPSRQSMDADDTHRASSGATYLFADGFEFKTVSADTLMASTSRGPPVQTSGPSPGDAMWKFTSRPQQPYDERAANSGPTVPANPSNGTDRATFLLSDTWSHSQVTVKAADHSNHTTASHQDVMGKVKTVKNTQASFTAPQNSNEELLFSPMELLPLTLDKGLRRATATCKSDQVEGQDFPQLKEVYDAAALSIAARDSNSMEAFEGQTMTLAPLPLFANVVTMDTKRLLASNDVSSELAVRNKLTQKMPGGEVFVTLSLLNKDARPKSADAAHSACSKVVLPARSRTSGPTVLPENLEETPDKPPRHQKVTESIQTSTSESAPMMGQACPSRPPLNEGKESKSRSQAATEQSRIPTPADSTERISRRDKASKDLPKNLELSKKINASTTLLGKKIASTSTEHQPVSTSVPKLDSTQQQKANGATKHSATNAIYNRPCYLKPSLVEQRPDSSTPQLKTNLHLLNTRSVATISGVAENLFPSVKHSQKTGIPQQKSGDVPSVPPASMPAMAPTQASEEDAPYIRDLISGSPDSLVAASSPLSVPQSKPDDNNLWGLESQLEPAWKRSLINSSRRYRSSGKFPLIRSWNNSKEGERKCDFILPPSRTQSQARARDPEHFTLMGLMLQHSESQRASETKATSSTGEAKRRLRTRRGSQRHERPERMIQALQAQSQRLRPHVPGQLGQSSLLSKRAPSSTLICGELAAVGASKK